jgi:hypothetical protein
VEYQVTAGARLSRSSWRRNCPRNLLFGSTEDPENRVYHISLWQATDHENEMNMLETIMKELALSTEARNAI